MSGKTFVIICSLLFVQLASARVTRDAPPASEPLSEAIKSVSDVFKVFQEKILQAVGVENEQQFNKIIQDEAKKYTRSLSKIATELKKTTDENVEKIGNSDAVKQLQARVQEAINNLKVDNPEAAKNVDQLTKTTKSLIEGIQNIGNSESAKQIKGFGNEILEKTVEALKEVNNKIQDASKSKN